MKQNRVPRIGMRVIKTAVAVVLSYLVFVPFGLLYREELELGGVLGQAGPLYACIASIICLQSTVDQSVQLGISRLIGIGVGGVLGIATLLLGPALDNPWIKAPVLGLVCVAGLWLCLLLKRPGACVMACILPCVILITGVTGVTRYHYAVARIVETLVGLFIALGVNAVLPDLRPELGKGAPDLRVEVKNSTKKLCVIGDPVGHSKSPLIQNTMIAALGLDYVYLCQPVPRGSCRQWLDCARFAGYAGFNATMPHKEELVGLMDELDEDARLFGAVNTVCLRDGKAWGYNTDGAGFLRTLDDEGISPAGKRVLVLGAGGAAKAVCLKLAQAGADVVVCNRTVSKAAELCALAPEHLRPAGFDGGRGAVPGLLLPGRAAPERAGGGSDLRPGGDRAALPGPGEGPPHRQRLRPAGQPGGALPGALHRYAHRRGGHEEAAGGEAGLMPATCRKSGKAAFSRKAAWRKGFVFLGKSHPFRHEKCDSRGACPRESHILI